MPCLLLQKDTIAPTVDQVKNAIRGSKRFTEADAVKAAHEAHGVVLRNLTLEEATTMQQAFATQGVETAVIEAAELPRLPDAKVIRRLEFQPDSLVFFDALGRPTQVEWQWLRMISAGAFQHFKMNQTKTESWQWQYNALYGQHLSLVTETRNKVGDQIQFLLDLIVTRPLCRLQIEAESFLFGYLFNRPELDLPGKVALLAQMLAERAPHAMRNRGAWALAQTPPATPVWPHKTAFFEEESWMLWLMQKAG